MTEVVCSQFTKGGGGGRRGLRMEISETEDALSFLPEASIVALLAHWTLVESKAVCPGMCSPGCPG